MRGGSVRLWFERLMFKFPYNVRFVPKALQFSSFIFFYSILKKLVEIGRAHV